MSNKCLSTELKSSVNDDSLEKLGVLRITRKQVDNEVAADAFLGVIKSGIPAGETVLLKIVGDGYFKQTYSGESIGKEIEVTSLTDVNWYTSNGNYVIEVYNKYYFNVELLPRAYSLDVAKTFWTDINSINGVGYFGNLADLNPEKISYINLKSAQVGLVTYKDEDIARLTLLATLIIEPNVMPELKMSTLGNLINLAGTMQISVASGSIETFVQTQRANGRTTFSGNLNIKWLGASNKVTFNGALIANVQDGVLSWTAGTITFRGTTISA